MDPPTSEMSGLAISEAVDSSLPPLPASPASPSGAAGFPTQVSTPTSGADPSAGWSPPDPNSDEVLSTAITMASTWRDLSPSRAPLYLRALLNKPRPELSRAVVDHLLSSDACLSALLDFIVRPVGVPMHEGAGSLGQDALLAAAAGLLPRAGGGGRRRRRGPRAVWARAARAGAVRGRRRGRLRCTGRS